MVGNSLTRSGLTAATSTHHLFKGSFGIVIRKIRVSYAAWKHPVGQCADVAGFCLVRSLFLQSRRELVNELRLQRTLFGILDTEIGAGNLCLLSKRMVILFRSSQVIRVAQSRSWSPCE